MHISNYYKRTVTQHRLIAVIYCNKHAEILKTQVTFKYCTFKYVLRQSLCSETEVHARAHRNANTDAHPTPKEMRSHSASAQQVRPHSATYFYYYYYYHHHHLVGNHGERWQQQIIIFPQCHFTVPGYLVPKCCCLPGAQESGNCGARTGREPGRGIEQSTTAPCTGLTRKQQQQATAFLQGLLTNPAVVAPSHCLESQLGPWA